MNVMLIHQAVPVLKVADVGASINWYHDMRGFAGDPFPDLPPYQFANLCHGKTELMLQYGPETAARHPKPYRWDVYFRLGGGQLRQLFAKMSSAGVVSRRLERMFYGLAEFEITDPDGYVLCLSEELKNMQDLQMPAESGDDS